MRRKLVHLLLALAVVARIGRGDEPARRSATQRPRLRHRHRHPARPRHRRRLRGSALLRRRPGARLLSRSAPVQLGRPQLLEQPLRRARSAAAATGAAGGRPSAIERWASASPTRWARGPDRRRCIAARCSATAAALETLRLAMAPSVAMRHEPVAALARQLAQALALRAQHQRRALRPGQRLDARRCASSSRPMTVHAELLQLGQRAGEVLHQRDRHMLERAGGRLGQRAVERRAVAARHDEAAGAERRGRAQDGADVVRVGDLVEHDEGPAGAAPRPARPASAPAAARSRSARPGARCRGRAGGRGPWAARARAPAAAWLRASCRRRSALSVR